MTVELRCKKVYLIYDTRSIIIYYSKYARDHPKRFTLNIYVTCIMYAFTTCYLATRINTMTIRNGSLILYLTIATVKDNEKKKDFGKHCWKRRKCWIPAFSPFSNDALYSSTENTVHVAYTFWSANAFNFNKSRILQYGKEFMQNCCNHKPIQKYVSDPYQSLSSI